MIRTNKKIEKPNNHLLCALDFNFFYDQTCILSKSNNLFEGDKRICKCKSTLWHCSLYQHWK